MGILLIDVPILLFCFVKTGKLPCQQGNCNNALWWFVSLMMMMMMPIVAMVILQDYPWKQHRGKHGHHGEGRQAHVFSGGEWRRGREEGGTVLLVILLLYSSYRSPGKHFMSRKELKVLLFVAVVDGAHCGTLEQIRHRQYHYCAVVSYHKH